ncbi:Uncharacterized membrane protein YkoI [Paenibacillus uliginis N3/975]|uniref:Uncharacterized membrane protein YkoI n=2 Tax=Paenibacillus TaxID=44249 RepID=A0A1X7HJI1_9BACL|nr:Uncharacterized membrane protein YkoI [Paenibacillus uliginis N3/975]
MLNRKMWIGTLSAALLLGGTVVAASGTANGESANSKAETGKSSYISVAQAKKAALKVANGRVDDVDLERINGKAYYEVEIERSKGDVDVHIDAVSGKVLAVLDKDINDDNDDDRDDRNSAKYISVAQAKKAALKVANGRVDDVDLERKNGKAYYEVEIERSKGDVDVHIDAVSGKVLAVLDRDIDNDDDDDQDDQNSAKTADVKITSEQASAIATKAAGGGKVVKIELDEDDNRYIYEVEVKTSKGKVDVDIDAVTGKVLSVDHDDDHDDRD